MDRELVAAARHGDQAAFMDLVRPRSERLYGIALNILRDIDRAEDALQDALVIAWRDLRGLRDPDRFDPWLVTQPVSVEFGGLSGTQIDVGLAPDWTTPCRGGEDTPSAALFTLEDSGDLQTASPGERYRLIFLDVPTASGSGVMVIDVYAQDGDIGDLARAAAPIIESFDFDLGARPSPS